MVSQIKEKYSQCDDKDCHEIHNSTFYLKDPDSGKCLTSVENNDVTCIIINKSKKELNFFAIDECIIPDIPSNTGIQKCDALVLDKKEMWFIELKQVNWVQDSALNRKKRNNGRKKAVFQLADTINDFKNKGIDFSKYKVKSLISFPPLINEANPVSIPNTSSQARVLEYINSCGFSELLEGNSITF